MKANGGDIEVTVKKGWYLGFLGNYPVEKSRDAQIFWKCPHWYTEDDGTMSKSYMDFLLKHGAYKSEEEMYKLARKDVAEALKKSLIPYKASKCMFLGAHDGGNKGRKFMKPYLKFWEETLLN